MTFLFSYLVSAWLFLFALATRAMARCSACCVNHGCLNVDGTKDYNPSSLQFNLSIAGSCPHGGKITASGTLTRDGPDSTCADLISDGNCNRACGCSYSWTIADADIPPCGAYIYSANISCVILAGYNLLASCPHVAQKVGNWKGVAAWTASVQVNRTDQLVEAIAIPCFVGDDDVVTCFDRIQSCDDCSVWTNGDPHTDGTARAYCCCTCPRCNSTCNAPCGSGSQGDAHGCPLPADFVGACCQTEDCAGEYIDISCHDPDTHVVINCGPDPAEGCLAACGPIFKTRRYSWIFMGCRSPDDEKGCQPTACPPDPKNYGDFYVKIADYPIFDEFGVFLNTAPNCVGDFLEVGCNLSMMAMSKPTTTAPAARQPCNCPGKDSKAIQQQAARTRANLQRR